MVGYFELKAKGAMIINQCVTHRRPQNLCLKRVPKTVPMKLQNVETVPDKLPNFLCRFIRRLTDISERALKTWLKNP